MSSNSSTTHDLAPSFGYHPDPERLDQALGRDRFRRALVVENPVRELIDRAAECRVLWQPEVSLPEGVYWFEGIDDPLLMQVVGEPPGDAALVPLYALEDGHPLMNAWSWAERLWEQAAPVPSPLFRVNEAAVTHPGDVDVTIRDRKFLGKE